MKTLSTLLLMCLFVLPAYAKYSGGTGEPNDPYQIATAADLIALGETPEDYDKHFILTADIDLDPNLPGRKVFDKAVIAPGSQWQTQFAGVLDGNGHKISHLRITGEGYLGLFGQLGSMASVLNLGLQAVQVIGRGDNVGSLAGINWGSITTCHTTGSVSGTREVGGLIGENWGSITMSYSTGSVSGTSWNVGGLVGENHGSITMSYSTASVNGQSSSVGGLVGYGGGIVTYCYSRGTVNATGYQVGPLLGGRSERVYVANCYSTAAVRGCQNVGGWVILHVDRYTYTAMPLTASEMMDPDMLGLNGFANDPKWVLDAGRDYPRLAWEGTDGQIIPEPDIHWLQGEGTADSPYRIDTAEQLMLLSKASILWSKHFILDADIDLERNLASAGVFTQAVIPVFTGVFDGNGHTISHLTIRGKSYLGLFGILESGAQIRDLGVVDVSVVGSGAYVGGLAGQMAAYPCHMTHCYSTGSVSGNFIVGGLMGVNGYPRLEDPGYYDGGTVVDCHSTVKTNSPYDRGGSIGGLIGVNGGTLIRCTGTGEVSGHSAVGGLVGHNDGTGVLIQCASTGEVRGIGAGVGGLVGWNDAWGDSITASYSSASVNGISAVGGLVGDNAGSIAASHSTASVSGTTDVGGLVGRGGPDNIAACFWDTQASGQATSCGGMGKTTAQMQTAATFLEAGWDFEGETTNGTADIWWILEGQDYPRFASDHASWVDPQDGATNVERSAILHWIPAGSGLRHDIYLGEDRDAVADATPASQGVYRGRQAPVITTYDPGTLEWGKTYYWRIDEVGEADPASPGKGRVWRFATADCIRAPHPSNGTIDVIRSPILSWAPNEAAGEYDVYVGDDEAMVAAATQESLGIYRGRQSAEKTDYRPADLELNKSYYWRIDGIGPADPWSPWKGRVWMFTTGDFLVVVEDFESYADEKGMRIYETWLDGYMGDPNYPGNGTGSIVGNLVAPFAERTIIHSGRQSMPMDYNNVNEPWYSEAERIWEAPQDWTSDDADTLTLYFRGEVGNSPETLYMRMEDNGGRIAVVVHPDAKAVLATQWQKWHIALAEMQAAGVDVAAVKKMVIGVGDRSNPQPGGTGRIYIDDIRLTKRMP